MIYLISSKTQLRIIYPFLVSQFLEPRYTVFDFSLVTPNRLKRNQNITPHSYQQACLNALLSCANKGTLTLYLRYSMS